MLAFIIYHIYREVIMRRIAILDTGVGASEDDFVKLHVKKALILKPLNLVNQISD